MAKKDVDFAKGFENLLSKTEILNSDEASLSVNDTSTQSDGITSNSNDSQKYKRPVKSKYKVLKKCTLYLPEVLMDSLAIMKVKTKRDLSELAAEALETYLKEHNHLYENI